MAQIGKNFVFAIALVMLISSSAVATIDSTVFDLEMKRFETIEHRAYQKTQVCDKIDDDIEYRDCLVDGAVFALSARDSKNDGVGKVFDGIFSKIDVALRPGAALLIAQRAVNGFKATTEMAEQATYYEVLKNLMDHLAKENDDFTQVFEYIKDGKIEVSEDVVNARLRKMALKTEDLTEKAEAFLIRAKATAKADIPVEVSE